MPHRNSAESDITAWHDLTNMAETDAGETIRDHHGTSAHLLMSDNNVDPPVKLSLPLVSDKNMPEVVAVLTYIVGISAGHLPRTTRGR